MVFFTRRICDGECEKEGEGLFRTKKWVCVVGYLDVGEVFGLYKREKG